MSKKTKQKHVPVQAQKAENLEKKGRELNFPLWLLPIIYSVAFVVFAWIFLVEKNADTLFYMQSRGIGEEEAKKLMIRARMESIARMIPDEAIIVRIQQFIRTIL